MGNKSCLISGNESIQGSACSFAPFCPFQAFPTFLLWVEIKIRVSGRRWMDILFDPLSWKYAEQCWLFWGRRGGKGRRILSEFYRICICRYMKRDSIMSHSWETANWYHDFFNGFPHICAHGFAVSQCLSPSKNPICIHSVTMWIINRIQDQDL